MVVGAGHAGLVCATYLAEFRLRTLVLEAAAIGGTALTQEIAPGFWRVHFLLPREYFASADHCGSAICGVTACRTSRVRTCSPRSTTATTSFFDEIANTRKSFARFNKSNAEIYPASGWPNYCVIRNGGLRCRKRHAVRARGSVPRLYATDLQAGLGLT